MKKTLAALMLASALPLAACTADTPAPAPEPTAVVQTPTPTPIATAPVTQVDQPAASAPQRVWGFGAGVQYPSGATPYTITVSAPAAYTPGKYAAVIGQGTPIAMDISVTNQGGAPMDARLMYATASSAGIEAENIFDTSNNVSGPPSTAILPGQTATWKVAFTAADPNSLTVQVPGASFAYLPTIYSNAVA